MKKLREKFIRPSNVVNLQVPKMNPVIWHNISDKGKAAYAAVQKAVSRFMPGLAAIVQQFELINKNKKEQKKIPVFKDIKTLSTQFLYHVNSERMLYRRNWTVNFTVYVSRLTPFCHRVIWR